MGMLRVKLKQSKRELKDIKTDQEKQREKQRKGGEIKHIMMKGDNKTGKERERKRERERERESQGMKAHL